jgi:hypothetical protein
VRCFLLSESPSAQPRTRDERVSLGGGLFLRVPYRCKTQDPRKVGGWQPWQGTLTAHLQPYLQRVSIGMMSSVGLTSARRTPAEVRTDDRLRNVAGV